MADIYKWDTEQMTYLYNALNSQLEYLKGKRDFLVSVNQDVNSCWQGLSHSEFENQINVNIEEFDNTVSKLSEQVNTLDYIIHKCYMPCEEEISDKLSELLSRIES